MNVVWTGAKMHGKEAQDEDGKPDDGAFCWGSTATSKHLAIATMHIATGGGPRLSHLPLLRHLSLECSKRHEGQVVGQERQVGHLGQLGQVAKLAKLGKRANGSREASSARAASGVSWASAAKKASGARGKCCKTGIWGRWGKRGKCGKRQQGQLGHMRARGQVGQMGPDDCRPPFPPHS